MENRDRRQAKSGPCNMVQYKGGIRLLAGFSVDF
jgi:hypothetical protein